MAKLFFRQARIIGSTMGSPAEFAAMLRFIAEHRIEPTLDQVFPFDQAIAAHQRLLAGEQIRSNMLIATPLVVVSVILMIWKPRQEKTKKEP